MKIPTPYVVFLGDAKDFKQAKTAFGIAEWRPELCVGQVAFPECAVDVGLPKMTSLDAWASGAKTFLIGISPFTTSLPESYRAIVIEAMQNGLNIASPLHDRLDDELEALAAKYGVRIFNFRHRPQAYPKGNGLPRKGLRLLTVGTDCACGKKFTALSIERALSKEGCKATFRSTGQTGFLISQSGINNDTIEADFLSGAAEWLSPENDVDHWDVIEGQGALSHPSFGGGSLSLIYGSQPDVIVMCHEPGREFQRGVHRTPLHIIDEITNVLHMARRTNPRVKLGAISLFTQNLNDFDTQRAFEEARQIADQFGAAVFDPKVGGQSFEDFIYYLLEKADEAREIAEDEAEFDEITR
jgi:hypothetical protein